MTDVLSLGAAVIDSFISERQVFPDSNGQVVCRGHCGPIVAHGCNTFFWGKAKTSDFHTLNWRSCDVDKCNSYCSNPTSNGCFTVPASPAAGYNYPTYSSTPGTTSDTGSSPCVSNCSTAAGLGAISGRNRSSGGSSLSSGAKAGIAIGVILGVATLVALAVVFFLVMKRRRVHQ